MKEFYLNSPNNNLKNNITNTTLLNSDSLSYHKTLHEYFPTPIYSLKNLSKKIGVKEIYVKDESERFGLNAFKGLGASFAIHKLLMQNPNISTFCTATDGNHGRAVAWAATKHNKKSVIFVPKETSKERIDAISNHGAEVIQLNMNYEDSCKHASKTSAKNNWQLVQDTSWENYEEIPAYIMSGYITHLREMENSLNNFNIPNIDIVFLQAGVGSWPASCIWYYINRYDIKRPKLVLVEPENSSGILQSFMSNKRITPSRNIETIMAGLSCGIPSKSAWEIIKNGCDAVLTISDNYAKKAMKMLFFPIKSDKRIISGESGAAGLAGLIKCLNSKNYVDLKEHIGLDSSSRILIFSTEGNTDKDSFNSIINEK